jgi:hypothetical protein
VGKQIIAEALGVTGQSACPAQLSAAEQGHRANGSDDGGEQDDYEAEKCAMTIGIRVLENFESPWLFRYEIFDAVEN